MLDVACTAVVQLALRPLDLPAAQVRACNSKLYARGSLLTGPRQALNACCKRCMSSHALDPPVAQRELRPGHAFLARTRCSAWRSSPAALLSSPHCTLHWFALFCSSCATWSYTHHLLHSRLTRTTADYTPCPPQPHTTHRPPVCAMLMATPVHPVLPHTRHGPTLSLCTSAVSPARTTHSTRTLGVRRVVELRHVLPAQPHVLRLAVGHGHLEQQVLMVEGVGAEVERGVPARGNGGGGSGSGAGAGSRGECTAVGKCRLAFTVRHGS